MRRTIVLLASHFGTLILGAAIGIGLAEYVMKRANAPIEEIGAIHRMSAYVYSQRELGDPAAYEAALNDYLSALERRRISGTRLSDERVIATDIVLTHTRLALLFDKQGNIDASKRHLETALSACPSAYLKPCSADALREVVSRLDRPPRSNEPK